MKSEPILTISIPTYNRPKPLAETLRRLLPQASDEWVLHIHDNSSNQPVTEVHADILASFGPERAVVFRNKINVGISANILRCFEDCTTQWVITLSDDDGVAPDFIQKILEAVKEHPDIDFATFSTSFFAREKEIVSQGLSEFCRKLDHWGSIICISCCVYRMDAVRPYIRTGYYYAHTLIPHTAMLLQSLKENGGKCLFSTTKILAEHAFASVSWNRLNSNMMFFVIDLVPGQADQQALWNALSKDLLTPGKLAANLAERALRTHENQRLPFEIRCACYTMFNRRPGSLLLISILRFFIKYPKLFLSLVKLRRRLRGYAADDVVHSDLMRGI